MHLYYPCSLLCRAAAGEEDTYFLKKALKFDDQATQLPAGTSVSRSFII